MTRLPTSSTIPIAPLLSQTPSPLSFIFASHSRWPLPPRALPTTSNERLTISVLDSSFNPPHAAHQALSDLGSETAQLLAFTVSNADKKLDESELYHRLEMIRALAVDMHERSESRGGKWENVAVAVMDAPTFTKKSQVLNEEITKLLKEEHGVDEGEVPTPEFVFPVGWDTVIRIFAPRYYPPPGPDLSTSMETFLSTNRSFLLCARRGTDSTSSSPSREEKEFLSRPEVDKWVKEGKLEMFDLNEKVRGISSTEIRKAVEAGDWDKVREMVPYSRVVDTIKKEGLYLEK